MFRAQLDALQGRRRAGMLVLIDELRDRGIEAAVTSREAQANEVSFVLSPDGYNQLVRDSSWAHAACQEWLARAVTRLASA